MIGTIIRESDGRFCFYGAVENKASLWDAEANAPKAGFVLLDAEPPSPDMRLPWWNGQAWQATPLATDEEKMSEPTLDVSPAVVVRALCLRAVPADWNALTQQQQQKVGAILGKVNGDTKQKLGW